MTDFFQYFKALDANGENEPGAFKAFFHQVDIRKGELILKPGHVEQYLYFLEKGILRFFIEQDEKEITFDFALPGNFTSGYSSFLTRTPVAYYIQALTNASIYRISYDDLQQVYNNVPSSQYIGRIAAEQLFIRKTKREISLLTETAEQRYLNLLEHNTELVQEIAQKYLASYIGITPQALSRIRKRIS